ncbi:hypothetical protein [Bhargavaea beijingensis]|uniref:hypothetical protein n=1 Tax=Bhargavaea beijingensis TaxID=426756 RepID=UPI00222597C1|nr:hypothetical protein [Bhargavaea beijingensis]MCW1929577.1 hypothetical protein [Bhargavaea beijingensis]
MVEREQVRIRMSQETLNYIDDYVLENNIPRGERSEGLERIIAEHEKLSKLNFQVDYLSEAVSKSVTESVQTALNKSISQEIKKVRLGTNNVDRNTQILIELLQGLLVFQNISSITTTNIYKPELLTVVENVVHERITNMKQKKDSKHNKGGEKHGLQQ